VDGRVNVPLGYDASDRSLAVNPAETEDRALHLRPFISSSAACAGVKEEADRLGLRTKHSTTASGTERGGQILSRGGHIYHLLSKPHLHRLRLRTRAQLYPGQHPALDRCPGPGPPFGISSFTNATNHRRKADAAEPSLLAGLLTRWPGGERFTPSHAVKKRPTLSLLRLHCP